MINQDRLVKTFMDLVRIDSPSGGEKDAAEFVAARLRALGLEPKIDPLYNVTAFWPGTSGAATAPLLLNAHTDSVAPCIGIKPQVAPRGDVIRSDGTTVLGADDRAGVAAILEGLAILYEDKLPHRPLEIVITAQEEVGLVGAKGLDFDQFKSKLGFVLDVHGKVGTIITQTPSHNLIEATITGKPAHSGIEPEKGISAIVVAAEAIAAMSLGRVDEETTANIGVIQGGVARNIVAPECKLQGEARSRSEAKLKRQTNAMVRALERAAKKHRAKVEIKVTRAYGMVKFGKRDPVVQLFSAAAQRIGRETVLEVTGGGSDANVFAAHGIMCAPVGIGYEKIHTTEEFMPIVELVKSAQLVVELARS